MNVSAAVGLQKLRFIKGNVLQTHEFCVCFQDQDVRFLQSFGLYNWQYHSQS